MELKHRSASRPVRNRALVRSLAAACGIGIGYCRGRTTSIFATHRTPPLLFRSFLAPRAAPPTSDGRTVVEEIDHPAYREHPSFVYCLVWCIKTMMKVNPYMADFPKHTIDDANNSFFY